MSEYYERIKIASISLRRFLILRSRPLLLAIFLVVASLTSLGVALFTYTSSANAVTPTTQATCIAAGGTWTNAYVGSTPPGCNIAYAYTLSPEQQAQSFMYYQILGTCVSHDGSNLPDGPFTAGGDWINQANAAKGNWFTSPFPTGGAYLDGVNGIKFTANGNSISCSQTGIVNGALNLWKEWAPDEALCSMGFRRVDDGEFNAHRCTNASGGSDQFKRAGDSQFMANAFRNSVRDRVYGGSEPVLSDAVKYLLYYKTFQKECVPNATISFTAPTGHTTRDYAVQVVQPDGTVKKTYFTGLSNQEQGDKAAIYESNFAINYGGSYVGGTCSDLVAAINGKNNNGFAAAFAALAQTSPDILKDTKTCSVSGTNNTNGQQCPTTASSSCNIPQLGWILCPILTTGASIADSAYSFLADNFLSTDPSLVNTNPKAVGADGTTLIGTGTYSAWKIMQGLGNVAFVIAFLIIIFSQLTGAGITNYGVKKMLPRIVVAAILVNLSFLICQIAVDLSNILGASLKSLLEAVATQVSSATPQPIVAGGNDTGNLGGIVVTVLAVAGGGALAFTGISAVIIAVVGAVISLLTIFVLLIVRKALIVLLIVVAPLAFVAYLLPNTESLFQKWRKLFTTLLLLYPVFGLLYGACLLASTIVRGVNVGGDATLTGIIAYIILVVPLLAIFPLLKGSLDGIGKIGGAIQSYGQKTRSGAQGGVKGAADKYKNSGFGKFRSGFKSDRQARIAAGTFNGSNKNPLNWGRNLRSRVNTGVNKNRPLNAVTGGFGADRELAAQSQNRKDQQEAMAMFGGDDELVKVWAKSGGDTNHAAYTTLSTSQQAQFQKMRGAGHHRKATSHLAAAQYLSEAGKGSANDIATALGNANTAGASNTTTDGAWVAAQAGYRKAGRGDIVGEMDEHHAANANSVPLGENKLSTDVLRLSAARQEGWKQTDPATTNKDVFNTPEGVSSYVGHLNSASRNTAQALVGFDRMEGRAKEKAHGYIIAAARLHQYNETGATPTISSIEDAKVYFKIR